MNNQCVESFDGTLINFETTNPNKTALLFVHGWLGNLRWWDHQRNYFANNYQIVQMDLAGHGKSLANRRNWSVEAYAQDIKAVVNKLQLSNVVLIGHSMSGSNIVSAYNLMPELISKLILVDTLLNLDHMPTMEQAANLFTGMRANYKHTVEQVMPNFLFAATSPKNIVDKLVAEFTEATPQVAIASLEPFYSTDIKDSCLKIKIPVRSINSDLYPTNILTNKKYFSDYDCQIIPGIGHYPMLEAPDKFNLCLETALA